ncbi:glycosyltransferase family 39 protein [Teredinibacter sp. KSP-S5-2]|uniref:ArnT family glycosyltransferase n=1 Tax=Teredinibacter sp. KSP-S5-2 TaxID=3034506 RepID=UPI0029345FBB|nr:glycosyltransferase family 39 protein [Teredinibacter sp. KSP-S5-2]WNO11206.1 glycosyltransferase family 39 protein [Teredinibacter sp. KSP-S5-2]
MNFVFLQSKNHESTSTNQRVDNLFCSPFFIFFCLAIGFYLGLGWVPLFDLDEGAFTEATREMLASNNFSATYLDGVPRYDKPILFYWLQAASIKLFGYNEWAFRLPSTLLASVWGWVIFRFSREFFGDEKSKITILLFLNCLWVALIARSAIADATLNLFLTLAFFDIWRYFQKQQLRYLLSVYLWLALGALTKGPVAVVLPLAVSLLYLGISKADKKHYLSYIHPLGWTIFFAVVAPWVYAVYLEQGDGFFQGFIVEHNLKRFSSTRESHGGSLFYYLFLLPIIILPYSGLLVRLFYNVKTLLKTPLNQYLAIWFCVTFIVFSFSKTQLPHYILNGCVPLFLLFSQLDSLHSKKRKDCFWVLLFFGLLALLPILLKYASTHTQGFDGDIIARHSEAFGPTYFYAAIAVFSGAVAIIIAPGFALWQRLCTMGLLLNSFVFTFFVSAAAELKEAPIHNAIRYLETNNIQQTVVAYRMHMPSFSVYRQQITPLRAPKPGEIALVRSDRVQSLLQEPHIRDHQVLFEQGGILLVNIPPLSKK